MGLIKSIGKRYRRFRDISFNHKLGHYQVNHHDLGVPLYYKHPKHAQSAKDLWWLVKNLYFHHYNPKLSDVVVDLGAGYGEEVFYWLRWRCELDKINFQSQEISQSQMQYFAVEIQPSIYESLCLNIGQWHKTVRAWPLCLGIDPEIKLPIQASYFSIGSSEGDTAFARIPGQTWEQFCNYHQIESVDLLKMNIEGGEVPFLRSLLPRHWKKIKRLIISCHDFRAEHGDGEQFRTKKQVLELLKKNNYKIKTFQHGINWADDWIYAEQAE